jgi:hypothetical protein
MSVQSTTPAAACARAVRGDSGGLRGTSGAFTHVTISISLSARRRTRWGWNIYRIDVTNDGTNTVGANPGSFLGDHPHIGADANGIYLTTNGLPVVLQRLQRGQIYALSNAQLAADAASVTMQQVDTSGMVTAVQLRQRRHRVRHELECRRRRHAPGRRRSA